MQKFEEKEEEEKIKIWNESNETAQIDVDTNIIINITYTKIVELIIPETLWRRSLY